jgi:predicted anti-sigma-YlaC factor YlaD
MSCDPIREHLPWLLNGTLDPVERRQVLEHLASCAACRADLADSRLAWEIFDQHPASEEIVRLAWEEDARDVGAWSARRT